MRCVFAGTPDVAVASLAALLESRHEVVAVVSRPDAPRGRGRSLERSAVARYADEHGIAVLTPASPRDAEFGAALHALEPDCCPVVAYGSLIPASLLDVPRHGWVNLHFSLLPAWRGAAPVQRAILHGDDITGATTFRLQEGLDDGPILGTVTETIRPDDTSGDLLARLAQTGSGLLVATLDALEDGVITAVPQPSDGMSLAPKITGEDARIRWEEPRVGVDRRIRATTPSPGAWTMLGEDRLRLGPLQAGGSPDESLAPGEVRITKSDVWVGTGTTPARLGTVQAPGKRAMPAADWARGLRSDRVVFN